jgi:hypothetical protein
MTEHNHHELGRLLKLIPLLGSDASGELVASATAIGRLLKSVGLDWHDLAAAVERGLVTPQIETSQISHWREVARTCLMAGGCHLSPAERDFLENIIRWPAQPSEKQTRWLDAIARALNVRAA